MYTADDETIFVVRYRTGADKVAMCKFVNFPRKQL